MVVKRPRVCEIRTISASNFLLDYCTLPVAHFQIPIIIKKAISLEPLVHAMMGMEFKPIAFANQLL
jgi:hypothetical protein